MLIRKKLASGATSESAMKNPCKFDTYDRLGPLQPLEGGSGTIQRREHHDRSRKIQHGARNQVCLSSADTRGV